MTNWLRKHKFESHLIAFTLMILASIGLYLSVNTGRTGIITILLAIFTSANLLAMVVK